MKKSIFIGKHARGMTRGATFLLLLLLSLPLFGATEINEYALFKRTASPVWLWGDNGLLTVPKATPIGLYNIYVALSGQEGGKIKEEYLFNTSISIVGGTSEDVEVGYTRRQLIWQNLDYTNLSADVFHIKVRMVNLFNEIIQGALCVTGTSLNNNQFDSRDDVLFNPNIIATVNWLDWGDLVDSSVTVSMEFLFSAGEETDFFFNFGGDVSLFNDLVVVIAEFQGISKKATAEYIADVRDIGNFSAIFSNSILNFGVKSRFLDIFHAGLGLFNLPIYEKIDPINNDHGYFMAFIAGEIPLGRWIGL